MNSKIRQEVAAFTSNESLNKKLKNFYRCSKTITLLNSLFYSSIINSNIYREQVGEVQQTYNALKEALKDVDLRRFCQLWEIEYDQKILIEKGDLIQNPILIANNLPKVQDDIDMAETYGQIYQSLTLFCTYIEKMKVENKNIRPSLKNSIDQLLKTKNDLSIQYKSLTDRFSPETKEDLLRSFRAFQFEFSLQFKLN